MGYYSHYTLEYQGSAEDKDILNAFSKINPELFKFFECHQYTCVEEISYYEMKWYDHVSDMTELSKIFPDILFILWRDGEDDCHWKCYFKNGKSHLCEGSIVYEPFDVTEFDEEDNS